MAATWAVLISGYSDDDLAADEKIHRKVAHGLRQVSKKRTGKRIDNVMGKFSLFDYRNTLMVCPSNLLKFCTAAALTIISLWQWTLPQYNDQSIQCLMFSHFHTVLQSFPLFSLYYSTPLSHPLILPLCLCEEACSPAGPGCRDARLKGRRGERFLNSSCPPGLMQCISLLLGVFVRHTRRSITSDPSNDNLWASHPP